MLKVIRLGINKGHFHRLRVSWRKGHLAAESTVEAVRVAASPMISGTLKPSVVWGSSSAAFESCTVKDRTVASHPAPHVCWSTSTATGSCRVAAGGVNAEAAAGATLFSQEPTSSDDPSEELKVRKDTVGGFDVYYAPDDVIKSDDITASKRPLVLLFTWLNARPNHVLKYTNLYLEKGADVLVVSFNLEHVLTPRFIKESVNKLLSVLTEKNGPLADRPLIVHGFSVGAFVWGQLMIQTTKPDAVDSAEDECSTSTFDFTDSSSPFGTHVSAFAADAAGDVAGGNESGPKKGDKTAERTDSKEAPFRFNEVQQRITGVVLDSPTMTETMLEGVRQSTTSSVLGTVFKNVLPFYLKVFSRSVGSFYTASEQAYLRNPSGLPTLIFYSDADPVSPARLLDKVVSDWQTGGVDVHVQKWEDSAHVKHFLSYPEEYKQALEVFVDLCYARIKERSAS